MQGFGYSLPNLKEVEAASQRAEELARQAQQAAERAEQISEAVRQSPPAPRPPAPEAPIVNQTKKSFEIKDYAIPIVAAAALLGVGFFMWRQK